MEERRKEDYFDARNFLIEIGKVYDRKGMRSFEELSKRYGGESAEGKYLEEVWEYLGKRNSNPNTRIFSIDDFLIQDILDNVCLKGKKDSCRT